MGSWDTLYNTELTNNKSNPSDIGTVWFDDSDAEAKMLSYLSRLSTTPSSGSDSESDPEEPTSTTTTVPNATSSPPQLDKETTSILDLGCGNGSILHSLRTSGWHGALMGVDYSTLSIALAEQISATSYPDANIHFHEWDVLNGPLSKVCSAETSTEQGWDVVLDKGTFDAISLAEETDAQGRRIAEGYKGRVLQLLKDQGLFLITSCNWTEEELRAWFVDDGAFEEVGRVRYRTFSFGGVKGQTISTVCFRKV